MNYHRINSVVEKWAKYSDRKKKMYKTIFIFYGISVKKLSRGKDLEIRENYLYFVKFKRC